MFEELFDDDRVRRIYERAIEARGIEKGKAEGRAEGRAEGKAEGRAEGKAEGRAEGKAEGRAEERAEVIRKMRSAGMAPGEIERILGTP